MGKGSLEGIVGGVLVGGAALALSASAPVVGLSVLGGTVLGYELSRRYAPKYSYK